MTNKYNLTGSEKQIKWGNDIIEKQVESIDRTISKLRKEVDLHKEFYPNSPASLDEVEMNAWIAAKEAFLKKVSGAPASIMIESDGHMGNITYWMFKEAMKIA